MLPSVSLLLVCSPAVALPLMVYPTARGHFH
jgi:hypothetical protein